MLDGDSDPLIALYHARYLSTVADFVSRFMLSGLNGSEYESWYGEMKQAHTIEGEYSNTYGGHRLDPA
ncbi:hypothetical protein KAM385_40650 [Aeromonas hydrophila]|nr:hypothetical protein KAM385_40650 [Aeromonas hydrophila]